MVVMMMGDGGGDVIPPAKTEIGRWTDRDLHTTR
jgi:hypothetical protein